MTGQQERNWLHKYRRPRPFHENVQNRRDMGKMINKEIYHNRHLPELSEEQLTSPYAPVYYRPVLDPPDEILDALREKQLDRSQALGFDDLHKAFLPDSMPADNGWCILEDGTGYSTVRTCMPNVTLAMEKFWYGWFKNPELDYLNYKIWMPGWHKSHAEPLIEDVGWGYMKIYTGGFTDEKILKLPDAPDKLDSSFMHAVVSSGISSPEEGEGEDLYNALVKIYKRYGEGIQVQSFNYIGVKITDRGFEKVHDADPEMTRMFAWHNAYECHRMAEILPLLYEISKHEERKTV